MGKKIYVGNLPFSINEESLVEMFSKYGLVDSAKLIIERETGRSKGFAFVEMQNDDEAQDAIDSLNGQDCKGRPLRVNEARPQAPRTGGRRSF